MKLFQRPKSSPTTDLGLCPECRAVLPGGVPGDGEVVYCRHRLTFVVRVGERFQSLAGVRPEFAAWARRVLELANKQLEADEKARAVVAEMEAEVRRRRESA